MPPGTLPDLRLHSFQSSCAHSHSLPIYHSSPRTFSFLPFFFAGHSSASLPVPPAPSATAFFHFHPSNVPSRRTSCCAVPPLVWATHASMLPAGITTMVCPPACACALLSVITLSCVDLAESHSTCIWTCPCSPPAATPRGARWGDAAVDPGTHSWACTP